MGFKETAGDIFTSIAAVKKNKITNGNYDIYHYKIY